MNNDTPRVAVTLTTANLPPEVGTLRGKGQKTSPRISPVSREPAMANSNKNNKFTPKKISVTEPRKSKHFAYLSFRKAYFKAVRARERWLGRELNEDERSSLKRAVSKQCDKRKITNQPSYQALLSEMKELKRIVFTQQREITHLTSLLGADYSNFQAAYQKAGSELTALRMQMMSLAGEAGAAGAGCPHLPYQTRLLYKPASDERKTILYAQQKINGKDLNFEHSSAGESVIQLCCDSCLIARESLFVSRTGDFSSPLILASGDWTVMQGSKNLDLSSISLLSFNSFWIDAFNATLEGVDREPIKHKTFLG